MWHESGVSVNHKNAVDRRGSVLLSSQFRGRPPLILGIVRSPAGYTPKQVDGVVVSRRLWIFRNLAELKDLNTVAVVRE